MSASQLPAQLYTAPFETNDPGTGVAINVDRWNQSISFTIAASAAETNTLAAPTRAGLRLTLMAAVVGSGGSRAVTVASAYDANGSTVLTFDAVDERVVLESVQVGSAGSPSFEWRVVDIEGVAGPDTLATTAGAGITAGTGTIYQNSVTKAGGIITTRILIDLTGLHSEATDLDIIGVDGSASAAHLGQITAAKNGTILGGIMRCLEAPTGGDPNVALYYATEATGVEDALISSLTETIVFDPAADWTVDMSRSITGMPAADSYLYLVQGDATGTDADYTAGKFLIEFYGYDA